MVFRVCLAFWGLFSLFFSGLLFLFSYKRFMLLQLYSLYLFELVLRGCYSCFFFIGFYLFVKTGCFRVRYSYWILFCFRALPLDLDLDFLSELPTWANVLNFSGFVDYFLFTRVNGCILIFRLFSLFIRSRDLFLDFEPVFFCDFLFLFFFSGFFVYFRGMKGNRIN